MTAPSIDITVVIPTYGRAEKLPKLLSLLAEQTLEAARFECIVVDDGSEVPVQLDTGSSPYPLRLLRRENGGPGAARNTAIEHTRGALTLYLNDDTLPALDLLASHIEAHAAAPPKSIILGTFDFTEQARRSPFTQILQRTDLLFSFSTLIEGEDLGWSHCWTCNISLPTEALRLIDGFDEENFDYPIVEDVELGYRL
ncbi:MAG: glycosyltransferase involved in cell wall biosynthesis [Planctomycetota bacterium]|jgi:glycosyltransferase involved in cell wall biosynthesis